jgi:hypothetical protein
MAYVRKAQNKYLLLAVGDIESLPKGQSVSDPEGAVVAEAQLNDRMDIEAMPFDTPPDNFLKHIKYIYSVSAASVGLPGTEDVDPSALDDAVAEIRQRQLQFAAPFDKEIAIALCTVGKRVPGVKCPDPKKVADSYMAEFGPMSRRFADPAQEVAQWEFDLKYGRRSVLDLLRRDHRDASDRTLRDRQMRNLEENTKYLEELASRNLPADPGEAEGADPKMETVPQKQGKKGGKISATGRDSAGGKPPGKPAKRARPTRKRRA